MRLVKVRFMRGVLEIIYQTPGAQGFLDHRHAGKFDPGEAFKEALTALDEVCAFAHEIRATDEHPITASGVSWSYKKTAVFVVIPGKRSIDAPPGSYALPGVKKLLFYGDAEETTISLPQGFTKLVDAFEKVVKALLPRFVAHLSERPPDLFSGDGATQAALIGDDQAQQAKELSTQLTPAQLELLQRANEQPHPWASEWKGRKKKVLTKCIELHLVVVIDDRVRPSSLGLDILEILAAKEAR